MLYDKMRDQILKAVQAGKNIYAVHKVTKELVLIDGFYPDGFDLYGKRASDGLDIPFEQVQFRSPINKDND